MPTTQYSASNLTAFATVAGCARPVEEYLRRLGDRQAAAVSLRAVDAFLLHQLVAMLPSPVDVVDFAADATGGASTALWAAHPAVHAVWAPQRADGGGGWRARFADAADRVGVLVHLDEPPPAESTDSSAGVGVGRPGVVLIADAAGTEVIAQVASAVAKFPNAIVAVLGIGRIGDGGALELLLRFGRENPGYHLRALRELSPFLAESDLAVLHRANQSDAPEALQRIAQGFEGNFQFINLVQAVTAAALRGASEPGAERHTGARRSGTARPSEQDYGALVERVKVAVRDAVPAGASVLVVSKGDDALLKLDGRRASHFPQSDKGTYAGHHPADDEAAVEQLEALRGTGAEYLVLPATSVWWLEHYNGFRRHLENTAAVRVCRPDTCIVFALGGASVEAAARSKRAAGPVVPYPRLVELVRQAVARDVPADATVAVVGKGDSQLIDLPGRRGVHFPQTAEGIYSGHHPADSAAAIEQLNAARARGAEYLLFPATAFWWLDHYAELRRHLDERHRLVRDDETCVLYRLAGTARRRSAWSWLGRPGQLLDEWGRRLQGPADVRRKGHGRPEREAERESDGPVPGRNDAP